MKSKSAPPVLFPFLLEDQTQGWVHIRRSTAEFPVPQLLFDERIVYSGCLLESNGSYWIFFAHSIHANVKLKYVHHELI